METSWENTAKAAVGRLVEAEDREKAFEEALWAIRGSDCWPGLSAHEWGGTSGGRYKSEVARQVLVAMGSQPPTGASSGLHRGER